HISLSSWFRDYLYIPLGGNRKGKACKYINTMIVFLVSGLWHGANWTYVVWGGLHGFYQIVGSITKPVKEKCASKLKIRTDATSYKLMKMAVTFGLTCFAWIFFAADNMTIAVEYIARIFTKLDPWALTDGTIYSLGLDRQQMNILIISIIVLLLVDLVKYKKGVRMENIADRQNSWVRPVIILSLVFAVIVFGAYGAEFDAQQFIYFQF
ncbi:MAG: MBOAT family protein, partial [Clostridiales bacterium]|nr:MBOAT family protein [Clostridiales bacterium]